MEHLCDVSIIIPTVVVKQIAKVRGPLVKFSLAWDSVGKKCQKFLGQSNKIL